MTKSHKSNRAVDDIRLGLIELRRLFQRRELVELWESAFGRAATFDYADVRLLDAIASYRRGSDSGVTVGEVARALGVDPSRASREVSRAVKSGLLTRKSTQADGRRVELFITARGAAMQKKGSALTRARIDLALRAFGSHERQQFAALFRRFVDAISCRDEARPDRSAAKIDRDV